MTHSTVGCGRILDGKYQIDRLLASGGTSRIYVGHPLKGAGLVAIKQFSPGPDATDEDLLLFHREYQILEKLDHPGIPRVVDFVHESAATGGRGGDGADASEACGDGDDGPSEGADANDGTTSPASPAAGQFFIVEEFISGETLDERIGREGRLGWRDAVAVMAVVLDTLSYLHDHGIIFRDLKSSNLLVAPGGRVRLIDFGAARRHRPRATRDTVPLGTPGFASPEHYGTAQTDARSDVFSAGAVLYHMLTGNNPSDGTPWTYPLPGDVDVPRHVRAALGKAVALDPAERFESAQAFRGRLVGPGPVRISERAHPLGALLYTFTEAKGRPTPTKGFPWHHRSSRMESQGLWTRWRFQMKCLRDAVFTAESAAVSAVAAALAGSLAAGVGGSIPAVVLSAWAGFCASSGLLSVGFLWWNAALRVDVREHGMVVHRGPLRFSSRWLDLQKADLTQDPEGSLTAVKIYGRRGSVVLDGDWKPAGDLVRLVLDRAGLVEVAESASTRSTGTTISYVRRPEPRTGWGNRRYRRRLAKQVKRHGSR